MLAGNTYSAKPSEVDAKIVFGYLKKIHNQTDFDFSEVAPELFL